MEIQWREVTIEACRQAVAGRLLCGDPGDMVSGISIDSRSIAPRRLFWALRGERHDGHDFIAQALAAGAGGVVAAEAQWDPRAGELTPLLGAAAVILVPDTLRALGDLASWWRSRHEVCVIGVTGSTGKTTTKEMLGHVFRIQAATRTNPGNFNNLIGMPLSVLALQEHERYLVLEMGMNRPGEIKRLTEVADPDAAVITNVGMAHLEGVRDLQGVVRAKLEMFIQARPDALRVVDGDEAALLEKAAALGCPLITFGLRSGNMFRAVEIENLGLQGVRFKVQREGNAWPVRLRVPGLHNVRNALAAAATAAGLGLPMRAVSEGLEAFRGAHARCEIVRLRDGIVLLDDTYNSNPASLSAALSTAAACRSAGGRLLAGLGEMLELGGAAAEAHREAGRQVAKAGFSFLLVLGEHAPAMVESAKKAGLHVAREVDDRQEMLDQLLETLMPGDVVLLKGSRRIGLEKVAQGLREELG